MEFKLNDVQDNKQECMKYNKQGCMKLTLPVKILSDQTHAFEKYFNTVGINNSMYQVVCYDRDLFTQSSWIGTAKIQNIVTDNITELQCEVEFIDTHPAKAIYNYIVQSGIKVTLCPHYIGKSGTIIKLIGFSLKFDNQSGD